MQIWVVILVYWRFIMSAKSRLRILCEKHGINHEAAKSYKRSHTE